MTYEIDEKVLIWLRRVEFGGNLAYIKSIQISACVSAKFSVFTCVTVYNFNTMNGCDVACEAFDLNVLAPTHQWLLLQ